MMCLWAGYKEKYEKKIFPASLKSMKKGIGSGVGSESDPLVRGTDPGNRIYTKMSWIPNPTLRSIYNRRIFLVQEDMLPVDCWPSQWLSFPHFLHHHRHKVGIELDISVLKGTS